MPFIKLAEIAPKEIAPGFFGKFIHSGKISMAHWQAKAGALIPQHQHIHEMMVNVISGTLELTIADETRVMGAGEVAMIPSQTPHRANAITDCYLIDIFFPVREDYK
jgi:quercetin dioxygenase-like cupin family protein